MSEINYKSPMYIQLREVIRNKIEDGEYAPGTAIPSENQLAETYGINRISVRSALAALEYEGLLKSVQGKGVFVLGAKRLEHNLETLGGYYQKSQAESYDSSTRILVKAIRTAGPFFAKVLNINAKDDVWFIRSVENIDGEPACLEETYIPFNVLPRLDEFDIQLFSLAKAFEWEGVKPYKGEHVLRINRLDAAQAKLINITQDQAVMERTSITRDVTGRIISFERNYVRNDKATFVVNYSRN